MQNATRVPPYRIASVDHALQLVQLLHERPHVRVSDAAEHLAVAPSTAHRMLAMLVFRGFATQDSRHRTYRIGPLLVEIGARALAGMDIRTRARAYLDRLVTETGETVSLQILHDRHVLFVDSVESTNAVRVASRAGVRMPLHASSGGKAILACMSDDEVMAMYPNEQLEAVTLATRTSRTELLRELRTVRQFGYSVNYGETEDGLIAVGVAVRAHDSASPALAALTVAGPAHRMTQGHINNVVVALNAANRELSESL